MACEQADQVKLLHKKFFFVCQLPFPYTRRGGLLLLQEVEYVL